MRALALLLLTAPAMAQDLTTADCAAILAASQPTIATLSLPMTLPEVTAEGGWCQMTDIRIEPEGDYDPHWTIASLRFRGDGLAALPEGKPPTTLEVQLRKANLQGVTGDPNMDYLMAAQRSDFGVDVDLSASYDPTARILRLNRLDFDFPGGNFIGLTAQVDRVDLNSMGGMQSSVGWAGITSLGLTVTSNGLFEIYFLMAAGAALLESKPETIAPADHIASVIAGARTTVASLPDTLIDAPSKTALDALLAEMPNPRGTLTLNAKAPVGFGTPRFMGFAMSGPPVTLQGWLPVLNGVTVTATYTLSTKEK